MKSFWVLVSALFFALMGVFVKVGSSAFSSAELVFYRSLIGVVFTAAIMQSAGIAFSTAHLRGHVSRGVIGCAGLILYFYTMKILPLAMAVTLNHTAPIFFALIAALFMRERLSLAAAAAIALGFAGVALLLRPSVSADETGGVLIGLCVGAIVAIGYLFIRSLGRAGEPEPRTVFYYSLICAVCAGAWMFTGEVHAVSLGNAWILLGVGICATIAQLALTRAYKTGKSILTTSLTYANVLFASILGIVLWEETMSPRSRECRFPRSRRQARRKRGCARKRQGRRPRKPAPCSRPATRL